MPDAYTVVGWDFHSTAVDKREKLALGHDWPEVIPCPQSDQEIVFLSTCNRSEIYAYNIQPDDLLNIVAEFSKVPVSELKDQAYIKKGAKAVGHLFRVVSSLESLVLGEYQIVHQVKSAYEAGAHAHYVKQHLHALFQDALRVGKEVRNETAIGQHKVSVASIAVDLAEHVHDNLKKCQLALIGTGDMGELALEHMLEREVAHVEVISRERDRAAALIDRHKKAGVQYYSRVSEEMDEVLSRVDVAICATAAPQAFLTEEKLKNILRNRRDPLVLIDVAVPRDVEEGARNLDNVFLYNIDDLDRIVQRHLSMREEDMIAAEMIIAKRLDHFRGSIDQRLAQVRKNIAQHIEDTIQKEQNGIDDEAAKHAIHRACKSLGDQWYQLVARSSGDEELLKKIEALFPNK